MRCKKCKSKNIHEIFIHNLVFSYFLPLAKCFSCNTVHTYDYVAPYPREEGVRHYIPEEPRTIRDDFTILSNSVQTDITRWA
jgi:hypothetical protein